jgi:hypothetical protein
VSAGPYETFPSPDGDATELYLVRLAGDGRLLSPRTAEAFLGAAADARDVVVLVHGWNTPFAAAVGGYRRTVRGYLRQRTEHPHRTPGRSLVLGVVWPSTRFVLPWESGPTIARVEDTPQTPQPAASRPAATSSAAVVPHAVVPHAVVPHAVVPHGPLDPRGLLRLASVWLIQRRAGAVGVRGLAPLLTEALAGTGARVHLVGHSFGARLVLAALTDPLPRPVRSALLLQAAVNRWAFADDVPGLGRAGGFRPALDRVELPLLSTFSRYDEVLTRLFPWAMGETHVGEVTVQRDPGRHGALGGVGPAGLGDRAVTVPPVPPGQRDGYPLEGPARLVAVDAALPVDGRPVVADHGDVSNPATWWMLHTLLDRP